MHLNSPQSQTFICYAAVIIHYHHNFNRQFQTFLIRTVSSTLTNLIAQEISSESKLRKVINRIIIGSLSAAVIWTAFTFRSYSEFLMLLRTNEILKQHLQKLLP